MTRSERLADQLDRHWHKNLRLRLHGLAGEEYFWGAGAWLLEHPPTWHVGRTDVGRFGGMDDGLRVP